MQRKSFVLVVLCLGSETSVLRDKRAIEATKTERESEREREMSMNNVNRREKSFLFKRNDGSLVRDPKTAHSLWNVHSRQISISLPSLSTLPRSQSRSFPAHLYKYEKTHQYAATAIRDFCRVSKIPTTSSVDLLSPWYSRNSSRDLLLAREGLGNAAVAPSPRSRTFVSTTTSPRSRAFSRSSWAMRAMRT